MLVKKKRKDKFNGTTKVWTIHFIALVGFNFSI